MSAILFFFNDTATTEIYTLSLHDALPICAEVALTSPKHQSGTDRIAEVAKHAKDFSLIINVQGDEPLVDPQLLNRLVSTLQQSRQIAIVTAAHPFENPHDALSPHQVKVVIDRTGNAL